jgi:replication-associated recombination protein RarA
MKKLIVVFVVMLLGFSGFAQNTGNLLNQYINIKNALVNSDSKAASQAIGTFYQSVKSGGNFAQKPELVKATGRLNKASGLEKQRAAFHDVSTALWKLVKSSEVNEAVYYQYCPMKKANWLSLKKDIKNPYYGSSMLTCGTVAETK